MVPQNCFLFYILQNIFKKCIKIWWPTSIFSKHLSFLRKLSLYFLAFKFVYFKEFSKIQTHNLLRWTRYTSLWFLIGCNVYRFCGIMSLMDFQSRIWCLNRIRMPRRTAFQSLCAAGKQLADFSGVAVETCRDGGCSALLCLPDL